MDEKKINGQSREILVVDDEKGMRETLRDILSAKGYAVCTAKDGLEAVSKSTTGKVKLLLIDYKMPGMNGAAATKEFLKKSPHTRVVMITAFSSVDVQSEARAAGIQHVFTKPLMVDDLLDVVAAEMSSPNHDHTSVSPKTG